MVSLFEILVSDCSLLVSRNTTNFYVLILCPILLQNSLINSRKLFFLKIPWNFFKRQYCLHLGTVFLLPSQSVCISFSELIRLNRTSSMRWNRSSKKMHP